MIVITHLNTDPRFVAPGDSFNLAISDATGCEVVIREEITVSKTVDFVASFRFALSDGTCPGFHLTGIFGCSSELPEEIKSAVMFEDLPKEQKDNFINSIGTK